MSDTQTHTGPLGRLLGVLTYKSAVYREIARERESTIPAAVIVVSTSLLAGLTIGYIIGGLLKDPQFLQQLQQQYDEMGMNIDVSFLATVDPLPLAGAGAIFWLLYGLFVWLMPAWLSALAANKFFDSQEQTSFIEILRVFGFVYLFSLLGTLLAFPLRDPFLAGLIALIPSMMGNIVAIRAASGLSLANAGLSALFAFGVTLLLGVVLYCCLNIALVAVIILLSGAML
jgi:hypothetical protein